MGLKHGFRLGELEVHPLAGEVRTPQGIHRVSEMAIALLIRLAEAPCQVVPEAVLCDRLQLNSAQLVQCFLELQEAFGDRHDRPRYLRKIAEGYELLTDVLIDVPPVPTSAQILGGTEEDSPSVSEKS